MTHRFTRETVVVLSEQLVVRTQKGGNDTKTMIVAMTGAWQWTMQIESSVMHSHNETLQSGAPVSKRRWNIGLRLWFKIRLCKNFDFTTETK